MKKMFTVLTIVACSFGTVLAETYKWEDNQGMHFTDNPESIPLKYREKLLKREAPLKNSDQAISSSKRGSRVDTIKSNAEKLNYDDLFRYNERYIGNVISFRGRIMQIIPVSGDNYEIRVGTKGSSMSDGIILCYYKGSRLLQDDIIDIWGRVEGLETYTSTWKASITIPKLTVLHSELIVKGG
jgi:hypothetical protein